MRAHVELIELVSARPAEMIDITAAVEAAVGRSGVGQGMVTVTTMHTSSGITVNEGIPCLESDILEWVEAATASRGRSLHARYLDFDGRMGINSPAHLSATVIGAHAHFAVREARLLKGERQTVYFVEFDGPQRRFCTVVVIGTQAGSVVESGEPTR